MRSKIIRAEGEANATIILANSQKEALSLILNATNSTEVAKIWMLRTLQDMNVPIVVIIGDGGQPLTMIDISSMYQGYNQTNNTIPG